MKKFFKLFSIMILMISVLLSFVSPVNAQSAILKSVKAQGDNVVNLFSQDETDESYMNAMITNVDSANNTLQVTITISNEKGTAVVNNPEINLVMTDDVTRYFDVSFTETSGWQLSEESDPDGTVTDSQVVGANFKYTYNGNLENAEGTDATKLVYTIKLKEGVNADDLVGKTFEVLKEGVVKGGTRNLDYGYGESNSECSIPTFTFVKPEEPVKTGVLSNYITIGLLVCISIITIILLSKKGKMSKI